MIRDLAALLDRRLLQARIALALERLWSRSFAFLMILGCVSLAVLSGLFGALPWSARLLALAVAALAVLWSLRPVVALRWPDTAESLRRLEVHSELTHRPLTALKDRLAGDPLPAASNAIWHEHLTRTARSIRALKIGWPRSDWMARDPFALRNALGLALIVALVLNGSNWRDEVSRALNVPVADTGSVTLDAWITPPTYTGKPPLLLTSPEMAARIAKSGEVVVPERSLLIVRFNDARRPKVELAKPLEDGSAGDIFAEPELKARPDSRVHEARSPLDRPVTIVVSDGSRELANWRVSVVPDTPPEASVRGEVETEANGALSFEWAVRDDYGVSSLAAKLRLSDTQGDGEPVKGAALPLFEPPSFAIALPKVAVADADGKAVQNLTSHPWAGLMVDMVLTARDQASQTGDSKPLRFRLPERSFERPLAKALIEQRRTLVLDPERREDVVRLLDALTLWPEGILEESSHYLGVRVARTGLYHARTHEDIKATIALLWELAVAIEDGDVPDAKRALDEARKALQQALAEGAPPEKIAELMNRLREAMERYLTAMAQQAMRNAQNNEKGARQPMNGRTIRAEDLNRMLDAIDKLARSGANEAAQELLAQLEEILSNLEPSLAEQGMEQQMPPLADMLQDLGELLERQQELMDQTFRLPRRGEEGDLSGQEGREPGMRGQRPGEPNALARRQDELGKLLEQLMAELGKNGMQVPDPLGRAHQDMGEAADALRQAERRRALGEQGEAMDGLRQGAEAMARELMQQGMGSQGNYGRHGEARGDDRDPLGRPLPSRGEDYGPERDMLPDEAAIERARQILEYLRGRASDMTRPRLERDYLDRLLRGLY
jgi:uncharacterized protein (TIGR02302 family)